MSRPASLHRIVVAVAVVGSTFLSLPADAQVPTFKNFKHYPAGQWQQVLTGYRDNKQLGAPTTSTNCSGPLDPKSAPGIAEAMKMAAATCTTKTLTDEERLLEYETACKVGSGMQTMHVQLRAIDDRNVSMETRSTLPGFPETLLKAKATYLGACPAGAAAAASKPSAADCADLAKMQEDSKAAGGGAAQCAQVPPAYRAQCEAQVASGAKMYAALEAQCK